MEHHELLDQQECTVTSAPAQPFHLQQYLATASAAVGSLALGATLSFSSPALATLRGQRAHDWHCVVPGHPELSDMQLATFSSSVNIGALIGSLSGGYLMNKWGRRGTMLFSAVPFVLGWGLIGFGPVFLLLLCGRILTGVGCGLVSIAVPTYVGEIASPEIKGFLGSWFEVTLVAGGLYVLSLGSVMCWNSLAFVSLVPALVFVALMLLQKESPTFLLLKGRRQDAKKSLQHFRGDKYDITDELVALRRSAEEAKVSHVTWTDMTARPVLTPLIITLGLMFFQQYSGISAVFFNLFTILESAQVEMSEDASIMFISGMQVLATAAGGLLMDRLGRKTLLLASSVVMATALFGIGTYFQRLEQARDVTFLWWLPLASLVVYVIFFSIGFGPVPCVMLGEVFPLEVREAAASVATVSLWLHSFTTTLIFRPLRNSIGDSGVYFGCGGVCLVGFLFSLFVVRETKGKPMQEITDMFSEKKPPMLKMRKPQIKRQVI